jgi:hypothetical protein
MIRMGILQSGMVHNFKALQIAFNDYREIFKDMYHEDCAPTNCPPLEEIIPS